MRLKIPYKDGLRFRTYYTPDTLLVASLKWLFYYSMKDISESVNKLYSKDTVYVEFNDEILGFSSPPVMEKGNILVPINFLLKKMGAKNIWNPETRSATISYKSKTVTLTINDLQAQINGETKYMDTPARFIEGQVMVPLNFISESLGFKVNWDGDRRTAIITAK